MHDFLVYLGNATNTLVAACAPLIAYALLRQLGLQNDEAARSIVTTAITRGVGVMVDHGVAVGDPLLTKASTQVPALDKAFEYINQAAGPQLKRLGITGDQINQKIASQLALTLHVPTVQAMAAVSPLPEDIKVAAIPLPSPTGVTRVSGLVQRAKVKGT